MPSPHASFVNGILLGIPPTCLKNLMRRLSHQAYRILPHFRATTSLSSRYLSRSRCRSFYVIGVITVLSIIGIALFVLMTGASPSVVRAAIMGVALLLARHAGRQSAPLIVIVFAAFVMIVANPRVLVFDIGFQLSFLAVLGLAYVAPYLQKKMMRVPEFLKWKEAFVATISAQIAVLPSCVSVRASIACVADGQCTCASRLCRLRCCLGF